MATTPEEKKRLKEGRKAAEKRAKEIRKQEQKREKQERKEARKRERAAAKEAKRRARKGLPPVEESKAESAPVAAQPVKTESAPVKSEPVKEESTTTESEAKATKESDGGDEVAATERKASTKRNYHVSLREDGKWQVKFAKGTRALKLFDTQAEAIAFAKEKAVNQEGSITIHKKDGKIRKQNYKKQ